MQSNMSACVCVCECACISCCMYWSACFVIHMPLPYHIRNITNNVYPWYRWPVNSCWYWTLANGLKVSHRQCSSNRKVRTRVFGWFKSTFCTSQAYAVVQSVWYWVDFMVSWLSIVTDENIDAFIKMHHIHCQQRGNQCSCLHSLSSEFWGASQANSEKPLEFWRNEKSKNLTKNTVACRVSRSRPLKLIPTANT